MSFYTKNKEGILVEIPMEKVVTLLNNDVRIYSDKDLISELGLKIEKLQEENKNLEYESKKKDLIIENLTVFLKKYQNCEDAYTYREIQNEIYLDVHDYLNFII